MSRTRSAHVVSKHDMHITEFQSAFSISYSLKTDFLWILFKLVLAGTSSSFYYYGKSFTEDLRVFKYYFQNETSFQKCVLQNTSQLTTQQTCDNCPTAFASLRNQQQIRISDFHGGTDLYIRLLLIPRCQQLNHPFCISNTRTCCYLFVVFKQAGNCTFPRVLGYL